MQTPTRIGLTGGIGSGKSTVARLLADAGAAIIDADAISRQTTAAGGAAIAAIAAQFGAHAIAADGAMDRDVIRKLVFDNPAARLELEAIIHPLVGAESARQAEAAAQAGNPCVVFDIPLLVESGRWRSRLDAVVVVDCLEETQVARVVARSGWTREAVEKVIASQASRAERLAAADACIYNDGITLEALGCAVSRMAPRFGLISSGARR
ncbi:MAG: dephospho-CoA kinase [Comamonadaceae bacterium]|nr:MAG: dephospho-CoA kinase [Comamonadaceae bacterium]